MKRFLSTLVSILLLATYFAQPVLATTNDHKDFDIQEIRKQLELNGVDD